MGGADLNGRSKVCVYCSLLDVPDIFADGATGCRRLRKLRWGATALAFSFCWMLVGFLHIYHTMITDKNKHGVASARILRAI